MRRIHRATLFVFLREQRHQLFTPDFQDELARALYAAMTPRTLEVAQASGLFSPTALRVTLDSSPLWGAGRVDDTYNLLLGQWQERRAPYCGQRKNLFDRRRCAVVDTLHVVSRLQAQAQQAT